MSSQSQPDMNIIIYDDPCYGVCDLEDTKVDKLIDLVIHFVHTLIPIKTDCLVLFVEAHSSEDTEAPILDVFNNLNIDVNTIFLLQLYT